MVPVEPSTELFRWHLQKIAQATGRDLQPLLFDAWLEFAFWNAREKFSGGLCDFFGKWPAKTLDFARSYASVRTITSVEPLTAVPMMYMAAIDLASQGDLVEHLLTPLPRCYAGSRRPPSVLLAGRYYGANQHQDGRVLEVLSEPHSPSGIKISLASGLKSTFKLSHVKASSDANRISNSSPYIMFAAELRLQPMT